MTRLLLGSCARFVAAAALGACAPAHSHAQRAVPDSTNVQAATAANMQMGGMPMGAEHGMEMSHAHMHMTALRPTNARDSVRAARLASNIRVALAKYQDVHVALADGYKEFLPDVPQQVYHFTSWRNALAEAFRFDAAQPTSLLYRKGADGNFTLVGAMYTEPRRATEVDLDQRVPLSVAQWHQHVNLCVPPRGESARWAEVRDGKPVFGPASPIATDDACKAVGGHFISHLFGWMVHANVFASDDPAVIWGHVD